MNERITQLAQQAGMYVDLKGEPWPKAMSAEECQVAYKKFAELLVRECAEWVDRNLGLVDEEAKADLLKHFGVEE